MLSQSNPQLKSIQILQDETAQKEVIMKKAQDSIKGLFQQARLNVFSREAQRKKRRQELKRKKEQNNGKAKLKKSVSLGIDLDDPMQLEQLAAHRFGNYKNHFTDMSSRQNVATDEAINSIIISNDNQLAISVTQNEYHKCSVTTYDLMFDDFKNVEINFKLSGSKVIKAQSVVQDEKGQIFCIPYFDSGKYKLRVFTREIENLGQFDDINKQLGISENQRYVPDFDFPSITANFIEESVLFVNLFDNVSLNHWSFKYNFKTKKVFQKYKRDMSSSSNENFIMICLADLEREMYHVLYRHGQCLTLNCVNEEKNSNGMDKDDQVEKRSQIQQVSRIGVGNAYLINSQCMVFRHSTEVLFFRRELSKDYQTESRHHHNFYTWVNHFTLNEVCQIFSALNSNGIIITTDKKIFYYKFDDNQMPILTSTVFNFMGCSQFIESLNKEIYISYSAGLEDFTVIMRKNQHSFRVPIDFKNHRYSVAERLMNANAYCISDRNTITIYKQSKNNKYIRRITIEVFKEEESKFQISEMDDRNNQLILNMKVSPSEKTLVVLTGNIEENKQSKVNYIFVFTLNYQDIYKKHKSIQDATLMNDLHFPKELEDISILFEFVQPKRENIEPHMIVMIDEDEIYLFDFQKGHLRKIFNFPSIIGFSLQRKPEQFVINQSQTIAFIQAQGDVLLIDLVTHQKIDLDEKFSIGEIKACINAYEHFYIVCNKRLKSKQNGIFLLRINENDFEKIHDDDYSENQAEKCFLLKWSTQLEIGDVDIYIVEDNINNRKRNSSGNWKNELKTPIQEDHRELIISYKSIYINKYDIIVLQLSDGSLIFRHESFHLWEQHIKGIFISQHQFLTISQAGVYAQSLSHKKGIMSFKDPNNSKIERRLHSLQEADYLKNSHKNHIVFKYTSDLNKIEINIMGQYNNKRNGQTQFQNIYSILIEEMNLWEILVFQGIFCSSSQDEMAKMIKQLPDASILFKSYLELDMANLVTILSFDSETVEALLSPQNIEKIDKNYPIFYNIVCDKKSSQDITNVEKYSAVDIALRNNQYSALNHIIKYVVMYQNSFVYSYLFEKNFKKLLEKGIFLKDLLNSQIIAPVIDFDENEWPQTHTDPAKIIKPFNGSKFDLRSQYDIIFWKLAEDEPRQQKARSDPLEKVYKIKYTVNFLPIMDAGENHEPGVFSPEELDVSLMELLGDTEQIEIFQTKAIQDFVAYKWVKYGKQVHYISAFFHIVYILSFFFYVNEKYLLRHLDHKIAPLTLMLICNLYGLCYDMTQWKNQGRMYLTDPWNINDQFFIWTGFYNLYIQFNSKMHFKPQGQLIMIIFVIFMLVKTFFFLRIFETFTKLVIMIKNVFYDLKVFIWFYILLLIMFSVILGVLGVGNYRAINDEELKEIMRSALEDSHNLDEEIPGYEYGQMTEFIKNIFTILRFSLGDFNFSLTNHLSEFERVIFWITWVIIVIMTCVIFLNFIIAEVSQSYQTVNNDVKELVLKEKAKMINESEDMLSKKQKNNDQMFPKYLVIREVEE